VWRRIGTLDAAQYIDDRKSDVILGARRYFQVLEIDRREFALQTWPEEDLSMKVADCAFGRNFHNRDIGYITLVGTERRECSIRATIEACNGHETK